MDHVFLSELIIYLMAVGLGFLAAWLYIRVLVMQNRGLFNRLVGGISPDIFFLLSVFGFDQGFTLSVYLIKGTYSFGLSLLCVAPAIVMAGICTVVMVYDPDSQPRAEDFAV